jgi:hypothetical protein
MISDSVISSSDLLDSSPILGLGQRIAAQILANPPTFLTWAMIMMPGLIKNSQSIVMADWYNRPKRKRWVWDPEAKQRAREQDQRC